MPTRAANRLHARLAELTPAHLAAIALVLALGVVRLGPLTDPDVWWHLRTGDWIIEHQALPRSDPWSFASGDHWVTHEWLSQTLMAGISDLFGLGGIVVMRAVAIATVAGLLARQAFRRTSPGRALMVTVAAVVGITGGWGERPQLLSFLLLIPVAAHLRKAIHTDVRLWPLVPLSWLWASLHGLFFLAAALTVWAGLATLAAHGASARRRALRLGGTGLAMLGAAALTPNGPRLLLAPLTVRDYATFVTEWKEPDLINMPGGGLLVLLALIALGWARYGQRVAWDEIMWVGVAALIGLSYLRTVAVGTILLVPVAADVLGRIQQSGRVPRPSAPRPALLNGALATVILGITAVGSVTVMVTAPALSDDAPREPVRQVLAVSDHPKVINEYDLGGWMIWLSSDIQPAIDGRTEIYPVPYVRDYLGALRLNRTNWSKTIADLDADVAWLRRKTPLVVGLRGLGWTEQWGDDDYVVLVPPAERP